MFVDQLNLGAARAALEWAGPWASMATTPEFVRDVIPEWPCLVHTAELRASRGPPPSDLHAPAQGISPTLHLMPWLPEMDVAPPPPAAIHIGLVSERARVFPATADVVSSFR